MSFFQEYKRLDNLCKQMYKSDKGVSSYIEDMEKAGAMRFRVSGWDDDYKALKKYRHIRNMIAHDDGVSEEDNCDASDQQWIINFRERILQRTDPLALYRQRMISGQQAENQQKNRVSTEGQKLRPSVRTFNAPLGSDGKAPERSSGGLKGSDLLCIILVLLAAVIFIAVFIVICIIVLVHF